LNRREKTIGVIGGMGPEATVDFQRRLIARTSARDDVDHLHVLIDNNPKIPSRIAALIEKTGEDPAPTLCAMAQGLERQGADFLVIPCNTAHHYLPIIAKAVTIPLLDMVALSIAELAKLTPKPRRVGMLASPAVRLVGLYKERLESAGFEPVFPDAANEAKILGVIQAVKAGRTGDTERRAYGDVVQSLGGVDAFLIACTELSVLPPPVLAQPRVDALDVLVDATIARAKNVDEQFGR
jgi:aspartate racemase